MTMASTAFSLRPESRIGNRGRVGLDKAPHAEGEQIVSPEALMPEKERAPEEAVIRKRCRLKTI